MALCLALAPLHHAAAQNPTPASPPVATKIPTVSVEVYEQQLQQAEARMAAMEESTRRPLKPLLESLASPQEVRRNDGQTLTVSGGEWKRRAEALNSPRGNATKGQVQDARNAVQNYLLELRAWRDGEYQSPAAQSIVQQLESTGQIRTGPTRWQQIVSDFNRAFKEFWRRLVRWLSGVLPAPAPGKMPVIDPLLIQIVFYLTIGALVLMLGYLLWRTLLGRMGRRDARREVRFVGQDSELLQLPPDELRERAGRFAAEGNFREALRHRFIGLLVTLDTHGVWNYDTRRTNWEHIAALQNKAKNDMVLAKVIAPLSDLTHRFDRVRYGNAACNQQDWQHFATHASNIETTAIAQSTQSTPAEPNTKKVTA